MEGFLALFIVLALVQAYISARRRARKAVDQLSEDLHAAEYTSPTEYGVGRQLLAQAEQALDLRDWDKAEDICRFAESVLCLAPASRPVPSTVSGRF